ncbi:DUF5133 domain-containing protein [Streptomyces sp. NPDC091272]|uniref:DUF5133 domain-containing protein n=1 Tax=Streptomyces sp. NPDC091272 TaxID=3365981 RepID=UPI0037F651B3
MITPSPRTLRPLLARHADALARFEAHPGEESARVVEDLRYTLCVITGTSRIEDALAAAERILQRAAAPVPVPVPVPVPSAVPTAAPTPVPACAQSSEALAA